jgi:ParB family chromosome partitioning protein
MRRIRYKEVSPEMDSLVRPGNIGRISIGIDKSIGEFYFLPTEDLLPFAHQARKLFSHEEINALADSIKKHGVCQPLTVISSVEQKGKYEVISGERRLKAAKLADLKKVPCIILTERGKADEVALIENIHRKDLHPIELGLALKALLDKKIFQTQSEMSKGLFLKESLVSECLQLAKLDEDTRNHLLESGIISRDSLRKVIKASHDINKMGKILGINKDKKDSFSVIRVRFVNNSFNLQLNGIEKLDKAQKEILKTELSQVIQEL